MPLPQLTLENLAKAIGDIQTWLHNTRQYHPDRETDFRGGATYPPDGSGAGTTINVNLSGVGEILTAITELKAQGVSIMSAISDFSDKVKASFDTIGTAVDGLTGDIKTLNDKITALQNSGGAITPEDQALLDGIQAQATTVADKLAALDALTAPAAIPAP